MPIAERLRQLRAESGLSVFRLADILNKAPASIWIWERGDRTPNAATLLTFADYYGVSVDWLLGRTNNREVNL